MIEFLGLIIKSFDKQTERWNDSIYDLIMKSFDTIFW
jgi:hypothetical protein